MSFCINMPEQRLMVAAWNNPAEFVRLGTAYGLDERHFEDRLVSTVLAYVADCDARGDSPSLIEFEAAVREMAIPYDSADFHRVFVETTIPSGVDMADLISDVLELSEERAQDRVADIVHQSLKELHHMRNCPHCRQCINGKRPQPRQTIRKARKLFEYAN